MFALVDSCPVALLPPPSGHDCVVSDSSTGSHSATSVPFATPSTPPPTRMRTRARAAVRARARSRARSHAPAPAPARTQVEPRVLNTSGERARVSWKKIRVQHGDRVALFDGATGIHRFTEHNVSSRETSHSYTLYAASHVLPACCTALHPAVAGRYNMRRSGYIFLYMRASGEVAACSDVVTFAMGDDEPTQVMLRRNVACSGATCCAVLQCAALRCRMCALLQLAASRCNA